jgi:hypothetical protein
MERGRPISTRLTVGQEISWIPRASCYSSFSYFSLALSIRFPRTLSPLSSPIFLMAIPSHSAHFPSKNGNALRDWLWLIRRAAAAAARLSSQPMIRPVT